MIERRIYVSGPYSAKTLAEVEYNCLRARQVSMALMMKGHLVHCPHDATHQISQALRKQHGEQCPADAYERWMRLDLSLLAHWATDLFLIARSPGADIEAEHARSVGMTVWTEVDKVPCAKGWCASAQTCVPEGDQLCARDSS